MLTEGLRRYYLVVSVTEASRNYDKNSCVVGNILTGTNRLFVRSFRVNPPLGHVLTPSPNPEGEFSPQTV